MTNASENDDVRSMFDSTYLRWWDFPVGAGDQIVTIDRCERGDLQIPGTPQKKKKPVVYFVGKQKGLVLNKTNMKTIAGMFGFHVREWVGKRIAIYIGRTMMGDEETPCIRIRPRVPREPTRQASPADAPPANGASEWPASESTAPNPPETPEQGAAQ